MPLPKSVARQAAEADRIVRNINGANEPPLPPADPTDDLPASDPPPAAAAPVAAAPPPVPPVADRPIDPAPSNEWEQRYHVLQGKYNAEVPALQSQLQNSLTAMGNMGRELDTLKAQVARVQAAPPALERKVTDQDVQTWGPDMLDVIRRGAAEEAQKMVAPILTENEQLRNTVAQLQGRTDQFAQTQEQTRTAQFWTRLGELVPDWQALNKDQGFLTWLGQFDTMLGDTRQNMVDVAQKALNADRVAAFFTAYRATLAPPPASAPPHRDLARQVTPARSTGGAPPAATSSTQQVEIWSQQEIMDFYTDLNRGRWTHDPAGAKDMRARIDQAVAEGRVR